MEPTFRKVKERDIDLLLMEQFCCSPEFLSWFFKRIMGNDPSELKLKKAEHSVFRSQGQTDIELVVEDGSFGDVVFSIENKVGRTKQPRQAERYHERRLLHPKARHCAALIVPQKVATIGFCTGYERVVHLEEIQRWLESNGGESANTKFKLEQIRQALSPNRYPKDREFREQYFALCGGDAFKELGMRKSGNKLQFYPEGLNSRVRFVHKLTVRKLGLGRIELIFRRARNKHDSIKATIDLLRPTDFEIGFADYPTAPFVFVKVPELVKEESFGSQKEKAAEALRASIRLWHWFRENQDEIMLGAPICRS